MKRVLLIVLSIATARLTAQEQTANDMLRWEEEFRRDIRRIPMENSPFPSPIEYAWGLTNRHEVSSAQMAKVLDDVIRENLRVLEETLNPTSPKRNEDIISYACATQRVYAVKRRKDMRPSNDNMP